MPQLGSIIEKGPQKRPLTLSPTRHCNGFGLSLVREKEQPSRTGRNKQQHTTPLHCTALLLSTLGSTYLELLLVA